ncbi:MAG: permease prefix domain 1-containing protein [Bacillota bacterium]|nr:permease prefix domain 1-containing protein [Bacillota bacterium]
MNNVESYVKSCFKGYNVDEDLRKEIVSSINDRIADYINDGLSEDEAFENAVKNIGDLRQLANDQNTVVIEKDKIDFKFSIFAYLLLAAEMMLFYFASYVKLGKIAVPALHLDLIMIFFVVLIIYPVSSYITYKKRNSQEEIKHNFKKLINVGLISASLISIVLIVINFNTGINTLWCFFPVIGVYNWPIGVAVYKRLMLKR